MSRGLVLALLLASLATALAMLKTYLHAIIMAVLLASLFSPLQRWLSQRLPRWPNLAAALSVLAVIVILLVPSGMLLSALIRQGVTTVQVSEQWVREGHLQEALARVDLGSWLARPSLSPLHEPLRRWLGVTDLHDVDLSNSRLSATAADLGQKLLQWLAQGIRPVLAGTGQLVSGFVIMLFVLFFAFRDGARGLDYARRLLPLSRSQVEALLQRVRDVTLAVVCGTGITALAQGVAAMIAFWIVGIPALFWGTVLAAASLIPLVGTAIVWVPAVGYLVIIGKLRSAAFLAAWCIVVVGSLDNFLRPLVMGERSGMSSLGVFFSVLGGLQLFGPIGIVYGPLVFGLCAVCIYIYELECAAFLTRQDQR